MGNEVDVSYTISRVARKARIKIIPFYYNNIDSPNLMFTRFVISPKSVGRVPSTSLYSIKSQSKQGSVRNIY